LLGIGGFGRSGQTGVKQLLPDRHLANEAAVTTLDSVRAQGYVQFMAGKADHLDWAEGNFGLAERLWESDDPVERRWSTVVAYYAILQTAHAVAADLWSEHPQDHFEVRNVVLRIDPSRTGLAANIQESAMISVGARYIGDHQSAATWFAPYFATEEDAIERALELMRTVVPELRRIAWS
jgi:hypothetical protein